MKGKTMTINECQELATELMQTHGVGHWRLEFDHSKKRFGQCRYSLEVISLSKHLVSLNTAERVTNAILHEIAHAIAGRGSGHGYQWRLIAKRIGCDGQARYSTSNTITPKGDWIGKCDCNLEHDRIRKPRAKYRCKGCRAEIHWTKAV